MKEQSDTPRTDAEVYTADGYGLNVDAHFARRLERELTTATRERDEARAIANDRDAMVDHRDRALTGMYQLADVIIQERDEAIAEVERLRSALRGLHDDIVEYQRINHLGGYDNHWMLAARAALAAAEPKP